MKISLKAARVNSNLTRKQVSDEIGVPILTIKAWEEKEELHYVHNSEAFNAMLHLYGVRPEQLKAVPTNLEN